MSSWRPWAANGLLLFASFVVSLLLVEQLYRAFLFGWDSFSIEKMNSLHNWGSSGLRQPSKDPELVFELKPGLRTYFKLVPFETNSHGFRDQEYALEKPPSVFRIAVVGDSFTVPSGVRIEEAYHSRLERRLNEERPGAYEVLNFSVPGYTLRHYQALIERRVAEYDPDLILIGFCTRNDHRAELYREEYREREEVDSFYESFVLQGLQHLRRARKQDNAELKRVRATSRERKYMRRHVEAIGEFSRVRGVPMVLIFLDVRPSYMPFLEKLVMANGIDFVNVTLPFQGRRFSDYTLHPLDSHPNGAAHEVFAEEILEFLVENRSWKMSGVG